MNRAWFPSGKILFLGVNSIHDALVLTSHQNVGHLVCDAKPMCKFPASKGNTTISHSSLLVFVLSVRDPMIKSGRCFQSVPSSFILFLHASKISALAKNLLQASVLPIRIRDPVHFLTPGSGMVKKSGSGSGMNNPDHVILSAQKQFFGLKYLSFLMRIREDPDRKNSDPGLLSRIRNTDRLAASQICTDKLFT
jgi:hypothetical protein